MSETAYRLWVGFCIAVLSVLVGLMVYVAMIDVGNSIGFDEIRDRGRRAQMAGVPAQANPFIGENAKAARLWLDGWIDAKEQGTKP